MIKLKIAYIILTHNNPIHLNRMIYRLNSPNVSFFIHVDGKSNISNYNIPKFRNIFVIKNRIKVYWGEFSQVQAIINLLKMASAKNNYDYYIFLNGTDYPVRNNEYIYNYLIKNKNKEFISIVEMPGIGKTLDRIWYYRFQNSNRNHSPVGIIKQTLNLMIRKLKIKRSFPKQYSDFKFYGGCAKWALTGACMHYILDFINSNPKFIQFWRNTHIPDETFFHTIIGNSKFYSNVKCTLLYEDWSEGDIPAFLSMKHIKILTQNEHKTSYGVSSIIFARKFSDNSTDIINYIDKYLLK
jgi:hypothetical protein